MVKLGEHKGKNIFYNRELALNGNIIILGVPGSGKTQQAINTMIQLCNEGQTILTFDTHSVLDPENIHPDLLPAFEAVANDIDVYKNGIQLPLFSPSVFSDGTEERASDLLEGLTQVFVKAYRFGVRQEDYLRKALEIIYDENRYRENGLGDLGEILESFELKEALSVKERMAPVIKGNIFVDGYDFIVPGKLNVIRMSKHSLPAQRIICEVILNFVWQQAVKGGFRDTDLRIFIDECHNQDLGKKGVISQLLMEGRKYHVDLMLAFQVLPQDAFVSKIMMQSSLVLFFQSARNETAKIAKLIEPSKPEVWMHVINSLGCGEFISKGDITLGDGKVFKKPLKIKARFGEEMKKQEKASATSVARAFCREIEGNQC